MIAENAHVNLHISKLPTAAVTGDGKNRTILTFFFAHFNDEFYFFNIRHTILTTFNCTVQ